MHIFFMSQIWLNSMISNQAQWFTTVLNNLFTIVTVYANTPKFTEDAVNIVQVCGNALTFFLNTTIPASVSPDILALIDVIADSQLLTENMTMATRSK